MKKVYVATIPDNNGNTKYHVAVTPDNIVDMLFNGTEAAQDKARFAYFGNAQVFSKRGLALDYALTLSSFYEEIPPFHRPLKSTKSVSSSVQLDEEASSLQSQIQEARALLQKHAKVVTLRNELDNLKEELASLGLSK